MGGGCEHDGSEDGRRLWCVPPPLCNYSADKGGGGTPQNLMGGLSQNMGGEHVWRLKCCQKITVKEFDSTVAGYYKPASFQIY